MSSNMSINEQKMLDSYEKWMDYIYLKFHTHPTNLQYIDLSDAEKAELAYYQSMSHNIGNEFTNIVGKRKKKKVYSMTDEKHSNGLLRKKYR